MIAIRLFPGLADRGSQELHALFHVEGGADSVQRHAQFHQRDGHGGPHPHHHRGGVQHPRHRRDVRQHPADERIHYFER
jgi:hypothetical protein